MITKDKEKQLAISLRRKGKSYSEILKSINVAKSTLSLWLRSVGLSQKQKQRLSEKKRISALRGATARRNARVLETKEIQKKAQGEVKKISSRELWLIGAALYWAEGSKEKESNPGSGVIFTNSDLFMIKLYLKWLLNICKVKKEDIVFEVYIHENSRNNIRNVIHYWAQHTGFSKAMFNRVYFKKNKPKTNRTNIGDSYNGVLKVKVRASSVLSRKIGGWIKGIHQNCRVV